MSTTCSTLSWPPQCPKEPLLTTSFSPRNSSLSKTLDVAAMMGDQPFTVVVSQVLVVGQVQDHRSLCVVESRKATWGAALATSHDIWHACFCALRRGTSQ